MYKSRSRSMQHGAHYHDREHFDLDELYKDHPPALTRRERLNFEFGSIDVSAFVSRLVPNIREFSLTGIRKPKDVARELNKKDIHTATGDNWTPRLAYFLLSLIFNGRIGRQMKEAGKLLEVPQSIRSIVSPAVKQFKTPRQRETIQVPLKTLEMAQWLDSLAAKGASSLIKAGSKAARQSKPTQRPKREIRPGILPEPSVPHADQTVVQSYGKKRRIVVKVERAKSSR